MGASPVRAWVGIGLCAAGILLLDNEPLSWLRSVGSFGLGVGVAVLVHEWRGIRRMSRTQLQVVRAPEDSPNWSAWSDEWVDNPEDPTNDTEE